MKTKALTATAALEGGVFVDSGRLPCAHGSAKGPCRAEGGVCFSRGYETKGREPGPNRSPCR